MINSALTKLFMRSGMPGRTGVFKRFSWWPRGGPFRRWPELPACGDPLPLGYNSTGWTVALLADQLRQKYGSPIKVRTLRRRMYELGLRWKRPRYTYATKDPHRAQKKGGSFAG